MPPRDSKVGPLTGSFLPKTMGVTGGLAHHVGEGRASKLKNRYLLVGCGYFRSIFIGPQPCTPALAMSEELKSVEKPSYYVKNGLTMGVIFAG